jgi:hypothetical protein
MTEAPDNAADRSWTKGRVAMALVMLLAWVLVWCALMDCCGRAHDMEYLFFYLDVSIPAVTKVSVWIAETVFDLVIPLSLLFVAGVVVMRWRMKGRVWVGYAVGTLLTLVVLAVYLVVLLKPLVPKRLSSPKGPRAPCVRSSR